MTDAYSVGGAFGLPGLGVSFARSYQVAPFGRLRVANPKSLFESKFDKRANNLLWSKKEVNTGTVVYDKPEARNILSVVTAGDQAINQTKQRMNYQPKKGQDITITGIFDSGGQDFEGGYWDGSDGITFRNNAGSLSFSIWKNGSRSQTKSAGVAGEWLDPLDGSGPSGLVADITKNLLISFDVEWLGVGVASCYAEIGNRIIEVCRFEHSSTTAGVYMQTPNLPIRYQLTSNGGAGSISQICSAVASEGGQDDNSISRHINNRSTVIAINAGVIQPIVAWRLQSGLENTAVDPIKVSAITTSPAVNYRYSLLLNPSFGATPIFDVLTESSLEYASLISSTPLSVANAVTPGTGIEIDGDYISNQNRSGGDVVKNRLRIGADINGVADIMALCIEPFANGNFTGGVTIAEQL